MSIENGMKVTPGSFLGYIYDYEVGERGVFIKDDKLYSSLSGRLKFTPTKDNKISLSVESTSNNNYIPHEGDEIYARIKNIQSSFAYCEIFATKDKLISPLQGIIKHEHIKDEYKDFDVYDCFLPGDIILGRIISIDESKYIYITTKDKNHGVVFAKSQISNEIMMPINLDEMQCLYTNQVEKRKVAKPDIIGWIIFIFIKIYIYIKN